MNRQLKFGIILQYTQMILSALISFIYTPIMLRILGSSEYGLYNLSSSVISSLSLLSLGLGASYIRFYSIYKKDDPSKIPSFNALYLLTFFIIALIALTVGISFSFNVDIFLNATYSNTDRYIAKILFIVLAINLFTLFISSVFTSYVLSQEKFIFLKSIMIIKTVVSPLISVMALFFGYGSIGVVITTTVISFLVDLIIVLFCLLKLKMKFSFRKIDFSMLKPIFIFSIFIAINSLVDQLNWQTDKIILGKMLNGTAVAIYGVGATINSVYMNIGVAVSNVFTPRVNAIASNKTPDSDEKLTELMFKVGQLQLIILGLILTGFIFFGRYFVEIWAGSEYEESYFVAVLLICPVTISLIQQTGVEIQRAKNKHKFGSLVLLFVSIVNVTLSVILCKMFGIIGITIGTTIALLLGNGLIMNIYYHKKLGINIKKYWLNILKVLPVFVFPTIFGIFLVYRGIDSPFSFARGIIVYTAVYLFSAYAFAYKKGIFIFPSSMK